MRVVFLDFDGVLNAETSEVDDSVEMWSASWLDRAMVQRLARLVERAGARVVVSSSWRQRRTIAELQEILGVHGFAVAILDVTPRHTRPAEGERLVREGEISAWLAAHPEVTSFVILDDDQEFGTLSHAHVQTDSRVGITDADVARACAILTGGERT